MGVPCRMRAVRTIHWVGTVLSLVGVLLAIHADLHKEHTQDNFFLARPMSTGGYARNGKNLFLFAEAAIQQETKPKMCHYEVLGVPRDVKDAKLKKAYKVAALYVFHLLHFGSLIHID